MGNLYGCGTVNGRHHPPIFPISALSLGVVEPRGGTSRQLANPSTAACGPHLVTHRNFGNTETASASFSDYNPSETMKPIRKAVFPVAGLGTRFLPATKAMPKEMLPVVDRPLIQHVVDEAREAGIEHFIFVTGRNKAVIEDHFDRQFELE